MPKITTWNKIYINKVGTTLLSIFNGTIHTNGGLGFDKSSYVLDYYADIELELNGQPIIKSNEIITGSST